jgi:stage V sporulation protein SpoVS
VIEQELEAIGVIVGSIAEDRISELTTVPGVLDVEVAGEMQVS